MEDNSRYSRLSRMLHPRGIVFVGGSALEPAIKYTRGLGYDGVYAVINPRREQLCGIRCLRSAAELERPADVAFVAVPGAAVVDAVRDLAAAGVGAAVINSSGFAESGAAGSRLQAELLEAAGEMPLLGPNCPGFANLLDRAGVLLDHMGECDCARGVAVISNGGAYLADMAGADRSLPIAYIAGLGNQAQVSIAELLEVILDDERVSAVSLHFESLRDVARLSHCALKAHQQGIPVVALYAGKSEAGERAAQTHTASLSSDAEIASALFARCGFVEVESAGEALETLKMLTMAPAPKGNRMALATSSGTYAVMGADFAERNGLSLPPLPADTQDRLQALLEPFLVAGNPLDIATGQFWPDQRQHDVFTTLLDGDYDVAVQVMSFPPPDTWADESWFRSAAVFADAARAAGLPAVFVSPTHEGLPAAARAALIAHGAAPLQGFEFGMKAIAQALNWYRRRRELSAENMLLPPAAARAGESVVLDEAESKALLDGFGICVPAGRRLDANAEIPPDLPYPAVLKICDAAILHKSDIGGVSLNLLNAELLRFAREQMIAVAKSHGHAATSFLVEESVRNAVAELMVGIRRVDGIGFSLTIAIGGVAVELLDDFATLLLPCDRNEIRRALQDLRLFPTLCGMRGTSPADVDAALDTIEALAAFVQSRSDIVELEINPLILRSDDHGVVAADAVIRIKPQ